ncbi:hypothetical protein RIF29_21139 [Crotalaria pallida]|uniref:Transmembrane protein n=1 Tax=Crotalaria pallida TaxID=3830 RepID=A0AAN9F629_CROPI
MTKTKEIAVIQEQPKQQQPLNNLFSLFNNFKFDLQQLQLPFFNPKPKHHHAHQHKKVNHDEQGDGDDTKPMVVWFPKTQVVVPPTLETEVDPHQPSNKTSNPLILWQVYALGAIFISRWVWARWNERKGQGRSPNDGGGRPSDDVGPRPSDNE